MNRHIDTTRQIGIASVAKILDEEPVLSFFTGAVGFVGTFAITLNFKFLVSVYINVLIKCIVFKRDNKNRI